MTVNRKKMASGEFRKYVHVPICANAPHRKFGTSEEQMAMDPDCHCLSFEQVDGRLDLPDIATQDHLITLYFTYIHHYFPVIHKASFLSAYYERCVPGWIPNTLTHKYGDSLVSETWARMDLSTAANLCRRSLSCCCLPCLLSLRGMPLKLTLKEVQIPAM